MRFLRALKALWDAFTYDPRVELLRQMERDGASPKELLDAAFRMDC